MFKTALNDHDILSQTIGLIGTSVALLFYGAV